MLVNVKIVGPVRDQALQLSPRAALAAVASLHPDTPCGVTVDGSSVLSKEGAIALLEDLVEFQSDIETAITLAECEPDAPFGWGCVDIGEVVA